MRLLIVEDEPDLAAALRVGLRREGYAVDLASDGAAAMEHLTTTDDYQEGLRFVHDVARRSGVAVA